jgi:hypothetical protein
MTGLLARLRLAICRPAPPPVVRLQGTNLDGFDSALVDRAIERLRRFPPYADADYCTLHPDVAQSDFDPAFHAICLGAFEARRFFTPDKLHASVEHIAPSPRAAPRRNAGRGLGPVRVLVSSHGNIFMRDIARDLVRDLAACGAKVRIGDETSSPDARDGTRIIVAPHEFFTQGEGRVWMRDDIIRNAILFGTEQMQTPWFAQSLPFLFMARAAIDMSPRTAALLRQTGLPATDYLPSTLRPPEPLTPQDRAHPLFRSLPSAAPSGRPIDIAFLGTDGPRRHEFFTRNKTLLDGFASTIYLRDPTTGPIQDGTLTRLAAHIAGQAKISLNIHQDEQDYFEWHRMVRLGMANGSLVVSEPCERQRDFNPGAHYLEAPADEIPALLDWLLRSAEGQAEARRIRANAAALVTDATAARDNATRLCAFLRNPGLGARDNPV